jgi:hypothetical protein
LGSLLKLRGGLTKDEILKTLRVIDEEIGEASMGGKAWITSYRRICLAA